MKEFYPYLLEKADYIKNLVTIEERKFLDKLTDGEKILNDLYNKNHQITGEDAFLLYDTYGYPFEITLEFAEEHNITIDKDAFDAAMLRQKELARGSRGNQNSMKAQNQEFMDFDKQCEFVGYDTLKVYNSKVIGKFINDEKVCIVCETTPFYGEMGGQVGDTGKVYNDDFNAEVINTIKMPNGQHLMILDNLNGNVEVDDEVNLYVDNSLRDLIEANHTATHLLDQALKDVLGSHVSQQGSQVTSTNTRFDFNHFENVKVEQLLQIENIIKEKINGALNVRIYELPIEEAKKEGCTAVFGEKYGEIVRIVNISEYSKEFCGGCHVNNTSKIKDFAIASIESKGSGIFRVVGVTGDNIINKLKELNKNSFEDYESLLNRFNELLKLANEYKLEVNIKEGYTFNEEKSYNLLVSLRKASEVLKENIKILDKAIKNKENENAIASFDYDNVTIENVNGVESIFIRLNLEDASQVKQIADNLQNKYPSCLIFVMSVCDNKVLFVAKANQELNKKGIMCGKLVKEAAILCGGNGGGRPDFAQAGGKDPLKADEVFALIKGML